MIVFAPDHLLVDGELRAGAAVVADEGGRITEVLPAPPAGGAVCRLPGRIVVPGTVNAHNHSFQSLLRGLGDDLPFLEWRDRALYRFSPRLGRDGVYTGALLAFGEMLLSGVTTVCDFFYLQDGGNDNARAVIQAARDLGIRLVLARCFYDWEGAPAGYRETPDEARARFVELSREHAGDPMVAIHAAPHSLHGASATMIHAAVEAAGEAGVPLHIHLAEEKYQVEDALACFGVRPAFAADRLGALGPRTVVVHGCWFDAAERALLAERSAALAYNPNSNMFLGDGVTDVVDLHARGVRIALGTDGGCSNSRVSIFDEMRACALLQKVARTDGQAIDAETCFGFGTLGGAATLGLPVGRIAPGLCADLVALDAGDLSLWPPHAFQKNVVYSLSARAVTDVVVEGRFVVRDRKLSQVDEERIRARVRELTRDWSR
jgi:5-methylthioadenosine/S-adenosylhomocysteine deaminase